MQTHLDIEYKQYFDVDEKFVAKKVWIPCMEKSLEERILRRRLWKAKWICTREKHVLSDIKIVCI